MKPLPKSLNWLIIKCVTADNGKAGVELALKELPDLVICDIMMPVLDGYGVFHLLSKHPETALIPFIFLTAKSEKADFRKGMQMGADDYITKPFDGIELLDAIETRLKKNDLLKEKYGGEKALDHFLDDVKQTGKVSLTSVDREVFSYSKKTPVYKEGQRPRAMYYVVSGKVKTFKTSEDGKEFITCIYGPNEYFGYTAILEDSNYTDEAEALEDTEANAGAKGRFPTTGFQRPAGSANFYKNYYRQYPGERRKPVEPCLWFLKKKSGIRHYSFTGKIWQQWRWPARVINLSRENMAQSIGVATESLIRTLGDFKDEKLVEIKAGKLIVIDAKKLADLPY